MALIKKKNHKTDELNIDGQHKRDFTVLTQFINDNDVYERRHAARDLARFSQSVDVLCDRLVIESELIVKQAILDALIVLGDSKEVEQEMKQAVLIVNRLVPMLNSNDAALRNDVIEVIQKFPQEVAPIISLLLNDKDSDIRIFAIDVLQLLAHPDAPVWLQRVIKDEEHVNVIGAALDRLAEMATPEMIKDLKAVRQRFSHEPYICFSADLCINRLQGV
jgi:HEAT repeat protein